MCGRFYIDQSTIEYLQSITALPEDPFEIAEATEVKPGDIMPSMKAAVIHSEGGRIKITGMTWGFPGMNPGQLLINARAETALRKRTFSDSVLHRRCVVPAKWFYEWDPDHHKAEFSLSGRKAVYLAGFYQTFGQEMRFVILTTAANASMIRTHDRMPLMIAEEDIVTWINDDSAVERFLAAEQPELEKRQEYEQMRLF